MMMERKGKESEWISSLCGATVLDKEGGETGTDYLAAVRASPDSPVVYGWTLPDRIVHIK